MKKISVILNKYCNKVIIIDELIKNVVVLILHYY